MIQKIGQNPRIAPLKTTFGDSVENKPASKPEAKFNDGKVILSILGATAATAGAIALISRFQHSPKALNEVKKTIVDPLLDIEKNVFEPLKDFKGSKEEYAKKAYGLLVEQKGMKDTAPDLVLSNTKLNKETVIAKFSAVKGELILDSSIIQHMDRGRILIELYGELERFEKFGDVVRLQGQEKFCTAIDKKNRSTLSKYFDEFSKEDLIERLSKEPEGIKQQELIFPEGVRTLEKDEIHSRLKTLSDENYLKLFEDKKININVTDKEFWEDYLAQKGRQSADKIGYDIAPYLTELEKEPSAYKKPENFYEEFKEMASLYRNPFGRAALEAREQISKKWISFLEKNNLKPKAADIHSEKEMAELMLKIEDITEKALPDEQTRAEEFQKILNKNIAEKNPIIGMTGILNDLQAKAAAL